MLKLWAIGKTYIVVLLTQLPCFRLLLHVSLLHLSEKQQENCWNHRCIVICGSILCSFRFNMCFVKNSIQCCKLKTLGTRPVMFSGCNFYVISLRLYSGSGWKGNFTLTHLKNVSGWLNSDSYHAVVPQHCTVYCTVCAAIWATVISLEIIEWTVLIFPVFFKEIISRARLSCPFVLMWCTVCNLMIWLNTLIESRVKTL